MTQQMGSAAEKHWIDMSLFLPKDTFLRLFFFPCNNKHEHV